MVILLKIRNYTINFIVIFFVFIFFSNISQAQTSKHNNKNVLYIDNCGFKVYSAIEFQEAADKIQELV